MKGMSLLKTYSEKCPVFGEMNHDLYLEETDGGWNVNIVILSHRF